MSQMATARALPRSGATRAPRPLRLIAPAPPGHAGLVATCLVLLTAGFVAVLLLNTSMATGAFTVSRLQDRADELSARPCLPPWLRVGAHQAAGRPPFVVCGRRSRPGFAAGAEQRAGA